MNDHHLSKVIAKFDHYLIQKLPVVLSEVIGYSDFFVRVNTELILLVYSHLGPVTRGVSWNASCLGLSATTNAQIAMNGYGEIAHDEKE